MTALALCLVAASVVLSLSWVVVHLERLRLARDRQAFASKRYEDSRLPQATVGEFRALAAQLESQRQVVNALALKSGLVGQIMPTPRPEEEAVRRA